MKRLLFLLIPIVLIGSLVVWRLIQKRAATTAMVQQRQARAQAPAKVTAAPAQTRDIITTFEATGSLEAPQNVTISPKVAGRIDFLEGHEGDAVSTGEVLVRIDPSEVEAEVRQARAALAESQYRLSQAQLTRAPTNVNIETQIRQQAAGVASAQADYNQTRENLEAQVAAATSAVTDAQGRIDNAAAAIANARAAVNSAQANLDNATIKLNRILELYKQGFIAAQDVDDAKATVKVQAAAVAGAQEQMRGAGAQRDSAVAQKRAAEEQVKIVRTKGAADIEAARQKVIQAQAALDYAKSNTAQSPAYEQSLAALKSTVASQQAALEAAQARREDTVLTSPLDGYVTKRYVDPGAMATPGQPILALESFHQVWVNVAVPDTVSATTHIGQEVKLRFDALPSRDFTARVIQINPSADPQGRQFTVRATLDNAQNLLKPGMFAHVSLETSRAAQTVAVPREAVRQDAAGTYVLVVGSDRKAARRPVTVGASDAAFIQINQGLKAGENVITMSSVPVKDGQVVTVGSPAAPAPGQGAAPTAPGSAQPAPGWGAAQPAPGPAQPGPAPAAGKP